MHELEPYYNWMHLYKAEEDEYSPFFGREHSEFEFSDTVYNYYIHPQWDGFGSPTLYLKVLFADYDLNFAVIELIGEWNDTIENDIMVLKREVLDKMIARRITKFLLIAENVLNFHGGEADYYEELMEEILPEGGWTAIINMPEQSQYDIRNSRLRRILHLFDVPEWRTFQPNVLFHLVDNKIQ
jgi:hypothetical protein